MNWKPFAWVFCVGLLLAGLGLQYGPALPDIPGVSWLWGQGTVTQAVIVHESSVSQPLTPAMVEVLTLAPSIGVAVWDQNILGKGKKPSPTAQPFLDAAKDKPLPQLVCRWSSGRITSVVCPGTFADLRKAVGQ